MPRPPISLQGQGAASSLPAERKSCSIELAGAGEKGEVQYEVQYEIDLGRKSEEGYSTYRTYPSDPSSEWIQSSASKETAPGLQFSCMYLRTTSVRRYSAQ
jgi:hypothetical protein